MTQVLTVHWKHQDGYGQGLKVFASTETLLPWLRNELTNQKFPEEDVALLLAQCAKAFVGSWGNGWDFNGNLEDNTKELSGLGTRRIEGTHFMIRSCEVIA